MKTSKFSYSAIMAILKQGETGTPVPVLCSEHGMSSATYYKRSSKFDASTQSTKDASIWVTVGEKIDEYCYTWRPSKTYLNDRFGGCNFIFRRSLEFLDLPFAWPSGKGAKADKCH